MNKKFQHKNILITGGASGIGKIMARLSLEKGAKVIIWDIDQVKIDETILQFSSLGSIFGYKVDVSNYDEVQHIATKTKQKIGNIDILINNAGIVVGKYFHEHSQKDILKTIEINTNAPMVITNLFLQDMLTQNSGHICNIASSAGLVSNPKMSVYAGSKWAVVGWSDSLRLEMEQLKKNIKVTTIMPYYINTGMFDGVKSVLPILDPEKAAKTIISAIENNRKMVTLPRYIYRLTRIGQGLFPLRFFDWFAGSLLGIYKTMADFKGHKK
ncbi:SDR family oxidoreductase [Riemerella anatipestifer]|uniref:SDR family oxidoreductase n=1 Tax=Riemerella anatipestifer TaxID=34085 RepID=UPI00069A7E59|nr:SDR family oxidoreductase [Riemerella anatipestifer]MDY3351627.1 SDR family oxidoreductase [Riemerella anatipestifer]